jgi:hypothetical protein
MEMNGNRNGSGNGNLGRRRRRIRRPDHSRRRRCSSYLGPFLVGLLLVADKNLEEKKFEVIVVLIVIIILLLLADHRAPSLGILRVSKSPKFFHDLDRDLSHTPHQ